MEVTEVPLALDESAKSNDSADLRSATAMLDRSKEKKKTIRKETDDSVELSELKTSTGSKNSSERKKKPKKSSVKSNFITSSFSLDNESPAVLRKQNRVIQVNFESSAKPKKILEGKWATYQRRLVEAITADDLQGWKFIMREIDLGWADTNPMYVDELFNIEALFAPAIYNSNTDIVRGLIFRMAHAPPRESLVLAVREGKTEIVAMLLNAQAPVNPPDERAQMETIPLHVAVVNDDIEIAKLLLSYKAKPNIMDATGSSALHLAVKKQNMEMIKLLLANKVNTNLKNNSGATALHIAVRSDAEEIAALLIENGAKVTQKDNDRWTPLFIAYLFGAEKCIPLLIKQETKPKPIVDIDGQWPIHYAAMKGYTRSIQIMLDSGMNVDIKTEDGRSALSIATLKGDFDLVKFLVLKGAKVDMEVRSSSYLGEEVNGSTALYLAVERSNIEIAQYLMDCGADLNHKDSRGWTPLYIASESGDSRLVKILVERGAHIDVQNLDGWTPLYVASKRGHVSVVQYLLDSGASPSIADNFDKTPLYAAATEDDLPGENSHYTVVKMLLEKGADPNRTIRTGETPLISACLKGTDHAAVIELLCSSGSDPSVIHPILGSPLALLCKAIVEARKEIKGVYSQVEIADKQEQIRKLMRGAKELINHPESDLDFPVAINDRTSILSYIVDNEIDTLIQHPKVHKMLEDLWADHNGQKDSYLEQFKNHLRSKRTRFYLSGAAYIVFLIFYTQVAILNTTNNNVYSYYFTSALRETFVGPDVPNINTVPEFWDWVQGYLVPNIYNGENGTINEHDVFVPSTLTLRQLRVPNKKCHVYSKLEPIALNGCYDKFGDSSHQSYGPSNNVSAFTYTTADSSRTFLSITGAWYPISGGFIQPLNIYDRTEAEADIQVLKDNDWIDESTSAVMVEFVIFNANLNRFCICRILFEFTNAGGIIITNQFESIKMFLYSGDGGILAVDIIFLIMYLALFIEELYALKREGPVDYIKSLWNVLDLSIYLIILGAVVTRFATLGLVGDLHLNFGVNQFSSYELVYEFRKAENSLLSVGGILLWFKLLRYLRVVPQVGILLRVIYQMAFQVFTFIVVFLVVLVGYAMAFHLLLFPLQTFRTWSISIITLLRLITGDTDWQPIEEENQYLATTLYFLYFATAVVLLMNLLIAMLNESYTDVIVKARSEYMVERARLILSYGGHQSSKFDGDDDDSAPIANIDSHTMVVQMNNTNGFSIKSTFFTQNGPQQQMPASKAQSTKQTQATKHSAPKGKQFARLQQEKKRNSSPKTSRSPTVVSPPLYGPLPPIPPPMPQEEPQQPTETKPEDETKKDFVTPSGSTVCAECKGIDGHLTSCSSFKNRVKKPAFVPIPPSQPRRESQRPPEMRLLHKEMIQKVHDQQHQKQEQEKLLALLAEQQKILQQFIQNQNERMKTILKEELVNDISAELHRQTEAMMARQNVRITEIAQRLERRMPLTEFDYVYT